MEAQPTQSQINDIWLARWDKFLMSHPDTGFMQSSWYCKLIGEFGWQYFDAFLMDDDEIIGGGRVYIGPIEPGKVYFYMPDAPILSEDPVIAEDQFNSIINHVTNTWNETQELVTHFRIEQRWIDQPSFIDPDHEVPSYAEPRNTLYIDLTQSEEQILAGMKPKGRYNIKVARRKGVNIVTDHSSEMIERLLLLYSNTLGRKGVETLNIGYMRKMITTAIKENCGKIFFAKFQDSILAGAFVLYFGNRATYYWAGSSGEYRNFMAPYLLNFEIIRDAKSNGYHCYDFYGISPPEDKNNSLSHVTDFKLKFGGIPMRFGNSLDFFFHEEEYRQFRINE